MNITTKEAKKILQEEINIDKQNLPIAEANEYEEERQMMLSRITAKEKLLKDLEELQRELEDWKFTKEYVSENYISKDEIKAFIAVEITEDRYLEDDIDTDIEPASYDKYINSRRLLELLKK